MKAARSIITPLIVLAACGGGEPQNLRSDPGDLPGSWFGVGPHRVGATVDNSGGMATCSTVSFEVTGATDVPPDPSCR
jgi:hypothetical protein